MISDYLDRAYVLSETRAHRDWLQALLVRVRAKDKAALAALRKRKITPAKLERAIAALTDALKNAAKDRKHPQGSAYIPTDPITCGLQAGMTRLALEKKLVRVNAPEPTKGGARRAVGKASRAVAPDTSPTLRLSQRNGAGMVAKSLRAIKAAFVEGEDAHYGLDGFEAKFGALFTKRRKFNPNPALTAKTTKLLTLFVFGDWGTGLSLASKVAGSIRDQLEAGDNSRQRHVIHLGDAYYAGEPDEYTERMLPFWPVASGERNSIGSWSLNGNHDMYSGGHGYFDTLLREDYLIRWHGDASGEPSSFFLIEDQDWQVFGLDTSWNTPSLGSAIFGKPTLNDYGGQNGVLTKEQVTWMAKVRDQSKGCILLTHHQPGSSRSNESQHADEAVALLKAGGVYAGIDAWIWGHEHRGVVFKPKAQRTSKRLKDAPAFCACLGHGGIPVTKKNLAVENRIADVLWEEDRLDDDAPLYEGERVVPFGFGRIDTQPGAFTFQMFDHDGKLRYGCVVARGIGSGAPTPPPANRRAVTKKSVRSKK